MKHFIIIFIIISSLSARNFKKIDSVFWEIGIEQNIDPDILKAVALTENFLLKEKEIGYNKNGTKDIGLMQINTLWIGKKGFPKSEKSLLNIKNNIRSAAKILKNRIKNYGYSFKGIGSYHSKTDKYRRKWLKRFRKHYKKLKENRKLLKKRISINKNNILQKEYMVNKSQSKIILDFIN